MKQTRYSVKTAAIIAGINRTSFYKDYLETGRLSKKLDDRGKPYIEFDELCRVFGNERCFSGLKKLEQNTREHKNTVKTETNLHNPTQSESTINTNELPELKVRQARLEGEVEKLKALLEEKDSRMQEKDLLIQEQRERIYGLETRYDRLLEDRSYKKERGSLWTRLKHVLKI